MGLRGPRIPVRRADCGRGSAPRRTDRRGRDQPGPLLLASPSRIRDDEAGARRILSVRGHMDIASVGRRIGPLQFCIGPRAPLPITHVVNCSDAILTALTSRESAVFNLMDTGEVTRWQFCKKLAHHMKRVAIPVSYKVVRSIVYTVQPAVSLLKLQLSMLNPRQFECQFRPLRYKSSFSTHFTWVPPLDFDQAWRRSL